MNFHGAGTISSRRWLEMAGEYHIDLSPGLDIIERHNIDM